jgi:hypothetical protein
MTTTNQASDRTGNDTRVAEGWQFWRNDGAEAIKALPISDQQEIQNLVGQVKDAQTRYNINNQEKGNGTKAYEAMKKLEAKYTKLANKLGNTQDGNAFRNMAEQCRTMMTAIDKDNGGKVSNLGKLNLDALNKSSQNTLVSQNTNSSDVALANQSSASSEASNSTSGKSTDSSDTLTSEQRNAILKLYTTDGTPTGKINDVAGMIRELKGQNVSQENIASVLNEHFHSQGLSRDQVAQKVTELSTSANEQSTGASKQSTQAQSGKSSGEYAA